MAQDLANKLASDNKYIKTYAAGSSEQLAIVLLDAISSYLTQSDIVLRACATHDNVPDSALLPVPPSPYNWLIPSPKQG